MNPIDAMLLGGIKTQAAQRVLLALGMIALAMHEDGLIVVPRWGAIAS